MTESPGGSDVLLPGWSITRRVANRLTHSDIARYAGASGDLNRVHVDERYATEVAGHPAVVAHGMLTMGLAASLVTAVVDHTRVRRFGGRFVGPVHAGDAVDCTLTVSSRLCTDQGVQLILEVLASTGDGSPVFAGEAVALLP